MTQVVVVDLLEMLAQLSHGVSADTAAAEAEISSIECEIWGDVGRCGEMWGDLEHRVRARGRLARGGRGGEGGQGGEGGGGGSRMASPLVDDPAARPPCRFVPASESVQLRNELKADKKLTKAKVVPPDFRWK